jgi:uncharacterized protein YybS (DUF2232 family)
MTESGLLAALTVIMALIAVYVPVVGALAALIWPLPVIVLIVRHGLRWGIMSIFVSGVLMAVLLEPVLSLRMVIAFAPVGIMLGIGYRRGFSTTKIFLTTIVVSIVAKLIALGLVFAMTNINPLNMQVDMMKDAFNNSIDIYRDMHMNEAQIEETANTFTQSMQIVSILMPLIVVLMGILDTFINFIVAGKVLRRLGMPGVPEFPPFRQWHLPKVFIYLYGFGLVGMYWGGTRQIDLLYQIGMNLNMLATFIGLIQGLSLFQYWAEHAHLSKFVRWIILILILFNGMFAQILAFTGLFDMVFDYRQRFGQKNG